MSITRRRPVAAAALCAGILLAPAGCTSDSVLELAVGDCFQERDLAVGEVQSVPTVECAAEHDAEVYAEHVFGDEEFPGQDEVSGRADAACREKFEDFVGLPFEESELTYSFLSPTEEGWTTAEDRVALCVVLADEPVTGSLEGVER